MLESLTMLAMIRWDLVDEEKQEAFNNGKLTETEFLDYLRKRLVIHKVLTEGDSGLTPQEELIYHDIHFGKGLYN